MMSRPCLVRAGALLVRAALATVAVLAACSPSTVHAETVNQSFYVTNGQVNATVLSGSTLYIGGSFTTVGPASGGGVPVDASSGASITPYGKVAGTVFACVPDGSGGWYIGGSFTAVAGVPRSNLAHLLSGNTLDPAWNPSTNATVTSLALSGATVYAGGAFTTVNGSTTRTRLAAFDATTGTANSWDPQANNGNVNAIAIRGGIVYVGGAFTTVNGSATRPRLAAFDASTGTATGWNPQVAAGSVLAIAVASGSDIYVGGSFTTVNGSTQRNGIAAFDPFSGTATSWDPNANSTVSAIALSGSAVYVGGSFTAVNGSTTRNRIAALDFSTGTATSWDPNANANVSAIAVSGSTVYVGGTFTTVNGSTPRNQGAAIDAGSGVVTAWNPNFNAIVRSLAVSGSTVYVGGSFTSLNAQSRSNLAALDVTTGQVTSWNPNVNGAVTALAVDGSTIYAGGVFTTANGGTPRVRAAAFASNGTLTSWNPSADNQVSALAVDGTTVYAGGLFTNIGGQIRNRVAALDAATGLATAWRPSLSSTANAIVASGGAVYVGGSFTSASQSARGFAAINASSGASLPAWPETNGYVYAMAPDGSGGWYIGGTFTQVAGVARNYLAHVLSDMSVDNSWAPNPNGTVTQLVVSGATVYVVGYFTTIGGQSRNYLAAIDASGQATSWNPNPNNPVSTLAVSGSTVYVGGNFTMVGGQIRVGIAAIDATTGLPTSWNPGMGGLSPTVNALAVDGTTVYASGAFTIVGFDSRIKLAAIDAATGLATSWNPGTDGDIVTMVIDGTTLYAGGFFTTIGGASRSRIGAVSTTTGTATAWNPNSNAGVRAILVSGSTIYVGGDFFGPSASMGGQARTGVAALDATTGLATSWDPKLDGNNVHALGSNGSTVFMGGEFLGTGAQVRNRVVALDATTGAATAWNPNASGTVSALAKNGSTIYAGGSFGNIGGQPRNRIAALDATTGSATGWNPSASGSVSALAVTGTTVYAGGAFSSIGGQTRNFLAALDASTGNAVPWNPSANLSVLSLARGATTLYAGGSFTAIGNRPQAFLAAIEDDPPPDLQAVTPAFGGNSGPVTVTIAGHRVWSGATAKLARSGQADIVGTAITVAADSLSLTASFDLGGKLLGAWDVVVTNPDLQSATLLGGFTIGTFVAPQLRVDIVGPTAFRTGYPAAYDLVIQNPGNVDALSVPLWVAGIPINATVGLGFGLAAPPQAGGEPDWTQFQDTLTTAGGRYLALVIPRVPPGTVTRRVLLTVPTTTSFSLTAALTPPWVDGTQLRTCLADGGVIGNSACLGTQLTAINAYLGLHPEIEALNGIGLWAKVGWQCEGAATVGDALSKARQVLDLMAGPVEQQGTLPASCSQVLAPIWRQLLAITVGGSIDPNDKFGEVGLGTSITTQTWLPYTIQFENLAAALYPAQHVVVSDPLEADLDPATVSLGRISFGSYYIDPTPTSHSYTTPISVGTNLSVQVTVNLVGSQLVWSFDTFHPNGQPLLPTEGFLPPNDLQNHGQGSVQFTVRPRGTVISGATITNQAVLTFDGLGQNSPTWMNTVDNTPPASHVVALGSTQGAPSFTVQWAADNAPPDLKDYTVCVREDNGPYRAWRTNTTASADTFLATKPDHQNHTYSFYSVARDMVGNMETPPANPDFDAQTLSTTGVDSQPRWSLALAGARPNPARGTIHVWFTLANHERATIELIDVTGRRVTRREVGSMGPGPHLVTLDASPRLKSGIYFLRLIQGESTLRSRVAVVR